MSDVDVETVLNNYDNVFNILKENILPTKQILEIINFVLLEDKDRLDMLE